MRAGLACKGEPHLRHKQLLIADFIKFYAAFKLAI